MSGDEKYCNYCGVSYLIYHEIQHLVDQVKHYQDCLKDYVDLKQELNCLRRSKSSEFDERSGLRNKNADLMKCVKAVNSMFCGELRVCLANIRKESLNMCKGSSVIIEELKTNILSMGRNLSENLREECLEEPDRSEPLNESNSDSSLMAHKLQDLLSNNDRLVDQLREERENRRTALRELERIKSENCQKLEVEIRKTNRELSEARAKKEREIARREEAENSSRLRIENLEEELSFTSRERTRLKDRVEELEMQNATLSKEIYDLKRERQNAKNEEIAKARETEKQIMVDLKISFEIRERKICEEWKERLELMKLNHLEKEKLLNDKIYELQKLQEHTKKMSDSQKILQQNLIKTNQEVQFLEETVKRGCEERLCLADALDEVRNRTWKSVLGNLDVDVVKRFPAAVTEDTEFSQTSDDAVTKTVHLEVEMTPRSPIQTFSIPEKTLNQTGPREISEPKDALRSESSLPRNAKPPLDSKRPTRNQKAGRGKSESEVARGFDDVRGTAVSFMQPNSLVRKQFHNDKRPTIPAWLGRST